MVLVLPDMENGSFPSYKGLCEFCKNRNSICRLNYSYQEKSFQEHFYEELSTFYVACTRAKKDLIFTYSEKRLRYDGNIIASSLSCFLNLKGFVNRN